MFNPKTQILALDFDGVIADSIAECLVVGYNAYSRYIGKGSPIVSLSGLAPEVFAEGRRLRNFIRAGQDYVFIHMAIDLGEVITDQTAYDAFTEKHADRFDDYFRLFYTERQQLLDDQPEIWNSLNPLYKGIRSFLQDYPKKNNLYIATTKKVEYVIEILRSNHIELIEKNIFHANPVFPKAEIIRHTAGMRGTAMEDVIFIDDQIDTLIKVAPTGARCLLAVWGYNNAAQRNKSLIHHIPHLKLTDLLQLAF